MKLKIKEFLLDVIFIFLVFFILQPKLILSADLAPVSTVNITGGDEAQIADVKLDAGVRRLQTSAIVTVQSTFGLDPQGTSFFFFGSTLEDANGIGGSSDTVRVQIPSAVTPLGTLYPSVDVTTTVGSCSTDSNPERCTAKKVCDDLNANANFITANWKCDVAKDFAYVHVSSRLFNEFGTRSSWTVTCTGTTVCTLAFSDIARRSKAAELARSPNDPGRLGFFGITGTVLTIPGGLGKRFFQIFNNTVGTPTSDMRQDCEGVNFSVAKCRFVVPIDSDEDLFIQQIRCYGGCNGIKFKQHLCKNQNLANGIEVKIKSDNEVITLPLIKNTQDWKNKFSFPFGGPSFRIDVQSGGDQFMAIFSPQLAFVIRKAGTFGAGNDDYIYITINDNLTGSPGGNLDELECLSEGFREE